MTEQLSFYLEAHADGISRTVIDKADTAFAKARDILVDTKSTRRERLLADAMIDLSRAIPELCNAFNRLVSGLEHGTIVLKKGEKDIRHK